MSLEDSFPQTIFVKQYIEENGVDKAIMRQIGVVVGELLEVQEATAQGNYTHASEEVIDAMTAAMQILYMIPGYDRHAVQVRIEEVLDKNDTRGYYEKNREERTKGR